MLQQSLFTSFDAVVYISCQCLPEYIYVLILNPFTFGLSMVSIDSQVRHYYYRLVRRMNKLLGPELCLDAKNSKDTNGAMLRW